MIRKFSLKLSAPFVPVSKFARFSVVSDCSNMGFHINTRLRLRIINTVFCGIHSGLACVSAVSFLRSNKRAKKRAREGARLGRGEQKIGEKWGGAKREGGGVGRIACSQSQPFYRTPFAYERGAITECDWLLASKSKYDIRILCFTHNPTYGILQDQNRYGRVRRSVRRGL